MTPSCGPYLFDRPPGRAESRAALAAERAHAARRALACCRWCAHQCGIDRLAGQRGLCRAGVEARVFSAQMEVSDELELAPVFAIALSGCDLRCDFCITGAESWNPMAGSLLSPRALAAQARSALAQGARSIMFLGGEPTIHLHAVLETVAGLPDEAVLAWKTNAHGSTEARSLLADIFDLWVADYKFGNDECARRLARIDNYTRVVKENLTWARQNGELIVRHLLMPGHLECCWRPVAEWVAAEMPLTRINLRAGFWPAWRASRHVELRRTNLKGEAERALQLARQLGLNLVE